MAAIHCAATVSAAAPNVNAAVDGAGKIPLEIILVKFEDCIADTTHHKNVDIYRWYIFCFLVS